MSPPNIAERVDPEVAAPRPLASPIERLDRIIAEAEKWLQEQDARIGQAVQAGHNTGQGVFDLQKMQLLVATLREGRERLVERLPAPG